MINIWYDSPYPKNTVRGPVKVISNLIRSLEDCGVEYSINHEKYEHNFMIYWNSDTYFKLNNKNSLLIGPQVWLWDTNFHHEHEYSKIIVPSKWVENLHSKYFPQLNLLVWPVAIYKPDLYDVSQKTECLVYYKNRPVEHLNQILQKLNDKKISYVGLEYGNYSQDEFKEVLSEVKYCIIIDNTESQGIAIQEMMSLNKPLFVWDQDIWDYMGNEYIHEATSIPYWSEECGEYIKTIDEFDSKFEKFQNNLNSYCPEKYINRELSPKKSVEILLNHFNNFRG